MVNDLPIYKLEDYIINELEKSEDGLHFNGLFKRLNNRELIGSYSTLSNSLKILIKEKKISMRKEDHPGIPKRVYFIKRG